MTNGVRGTLRVLCAGLVMAPASAGWADVGGTALEPPAVASPYETTATPSPAAPLPAAAPVAQAAAAPLLLQTTPAAAPVLVQPVPTREPPPAHKQWWFWATLGAIAAGTVAVIALSNDDQSPPSSQLGNMNAAFRRQ